MSSGTNLFQFESWISSNYITGTAGTKGAMKKSAPWLFRMYIYI